MPCLKSCMKKICISCALALALFLPQAIPAEAADIYTVIYSDVASYNGDPSADDWITQAILYASSVYGVDPILIASVMETESHYNFDSISPAGAIGLMQLMPDTASSLGVDPYDALDNVLGGTLYLRNQLDSFSGWGTYSVNDAVAAYNAGPNAVVTYGGVPPYAETEEYVQKVSDAYQKMLAWAQYP